MTNPKWHTCGECIKTRERIKETLAANDGLDCSGENKEETNCSVTENCPGRSITLRNIYKSLFVSFVLCV